MRRCTAGRRPESGTGLAAPSMDRVRAAGQSGETTREEKRRADTPDC